MKKIVTLGLIVATLTATGCGNQESPNSPSNVQYFNPNPQVQVIETTQPTKPVVYKNISYDALVDLVRQNGESLEIEMFTIDVGKENERPTISYAGYGYGWANKMQGSLEQNILATINATDVSKTNERPTISYAGYGHAWMNKAEGSIAGNKFELTATKVGKKNERPTISYAGYGHAWTQEMYGDLGNLLNVSLITTDYKTENERPTISYAGYGHAWMNKAKLTISLK